MPRVREKDLAALPVADGRYMMINILARRSRQLNRERSHIAMDESSMYDPISTAMVEFRSSLLKYNMGELGENAAEDFRSADH